MIIESLDVTVLSGRQALRGHVAFWIYVDVLTLDKNVRCCALDLTIQPWRTCK